MASIWERLTGDIGDRDRAQQAVQTTSGKGERSWRDWRWWASRTYRMVCFGMGLVLLESYLLNLDFGTAKAAFPFAILNLMAALHSLAFPSFGRLSFHFILTYANLLLFGPGVAALSSGLGIFGHHLIIRHRPLSISMFHMGKAILAVIGAGWTFSVLGGRWGWPNLAWAMVISSTAAYLAINFVLEIIPSFWSPPVSLEVQGHILLRSTLMVAILVPASVSMFYIYFPYGADGVFLFLVPVGAFVLALELYARSATINRRLSTVQEISRKVSTILDPDQLVGEALRSIGDIIHYRWGAVWLFELKTGELIARHCVGTDGEDRPLPQSPPGAIISAARKGQLIDDTISANQNRDFPEQPSWLSLLAIPIVSRGEVFGVLGLTTDSAKGFSTQQRHLLEILAGNVAVAVQNAILYKQREREAIRDGLTRLYNHRFLQEKLSQEEERSRRYGRPFSFILVDIDHFKVYNDTYGHPAGDQLLIQLARILENSVRQVDFVARYGGEEFAIVLPECDREGALLVAERVRRNVEVFRNPHQDHYNLTISAGVSAFPNQGDSREQVLDKADQALYRAKAEGRNRVCS